MTNLMPLTVVFDDLMRHYDQFISYESTSEFLEFAISQEECRKRWNAAEEECRRLMKELAESHTENASLQKKIQEIRKHLEMKMKLLNKEELEKDRLVVKSNSAKALIKVYLKDSKTNSDFKERLHNILHLLETGDESAVSVIKSPAYCLDTISEAGSTDLSMTQSEDGLDVSMSRNRKRRSKRGSLTQVEAPSKRSRHVNSNKKTVEINSVPEQLIAKTVVSFPKDGPVHAVASVETYPAHSHIIPSAPPITSDSESEMGGGIISDKAKSPAVLLEKHNKINNKQVPSNQSPRFGRTLSSGGAMMQRPHAFFKKTVLKPEKCEPCGKRMKFTHVSLKCRDCNATCHPECKEKVPLPCVSTTGTPSKKHQMGVIADYVPQQHPMVPALIQHCVNEIEVRGLKTVGLYRVPGPEREVKELKEKFLKGKGIPNLENYDINSICGCVKDFLRSLQEPLIGRWFWRDFATAAEIADPTKRRQEMERLIPDLPAPNQDTLAFMFIHLQRVAECPDVMMPVENLSKVFGPTIVGYSEIDINPETMLKETKKQQLILNTLLTIPSSYWSQFVFRAQDEGKIYSSGGGGGTYTRSKARSISQAVFTPRQPQSTPSIDQVDRTRSTGRKKIYFGFGDDSPKDAPKTRSEKRNYFE